MKQPQTTFNLIKIITSILILTLILYVLYQMIFVSVSQFSNVGG